MRRLIRRQLERAEFEVMEAGSAEEGLRLMRESRPDAVTVDLMMPEVDGIDLLSMKRQDPAIRDIPALVVSAVGWQADLDRALALGAMATLTKPFSQRQLVEVLQALLKH
jgi:CheY-like chemotaxis protein